MKDPVRGTCCVVRTYERSVIEQEIQLRGKCPFCGKPMKNSDLTPGNRVKKQI